MIVPRHWRALLRVTIGHARGHAAQSLLLLIGVSLGVAVGVAIDAANGSAFAAFELSTEAVTGRATHRIVGGPMGLRDDVYRRLSVDGGPVTSAPVVEGLVALPALDGETLTLFGVDPFAEPPFRSFLDTGPGDGGDALAPFLTAPGAVMVSEQLADRAGVSVGDALTIDTGSASRSATVVALLRPEEELSRQALEGLVVADISTAQELLGRVGRLDRVDLMLPSDAAAQQEALAVVEELLPAGASVVAASEQRETAAELTDAFRLNLSALSLLALLVGMFLIFNIVRFSVVQRRRTLATLRILGVTRREVFAMILVETVALGAIGSILGVVAGALMARVAVVLVTQTINDLFFVTTVRDVHVPAATVMRGVLIGTVTAAVAALVPAWEAMSVPPVAALRRSDVESASRRAAPRALFGGVVVACAGIALLLLPGDRVDIGFVSLACIVFGFALAAPATTIAIMRLAAPVAVRTGGVVGGMAPRDVSRSLSRTSVAVAALMVAVCATIGVQVMVDSFRATLEEWLSFTLQADVFVSPRSVSTTSRGDRIDAAMVADLAALPGVAEAATARGGTVQADGLGAVQVQALSRDLSGDDRRFLEAIGAPGDVWSEMEAGAVMVTEPFARRYDVGVGDALTLATEKGATTYPIVGVTYDYSSNEGVVLMTDSVYRTGWSDEGFESVALTLHETVDAEEMSTRIRERFGREAAIEVRSNRTLRRDVLAVFDQAFAITGALRLLAVVVAFIGVLASLMALQLERTREYATLRATGLTGRQMQGLALAQTGLIGFAAGVLSMPAGLSLAMVLIYVINRRSFGWTINATFGAEPFAGAMLLAVAAALLAGVYPAWRMGRIPIARGLREE